MPKPKMSRHQIAMNAIADQFVAELKAHEREEHGGERCTTNRVNACAYLAHFAGVTDDDLHQFIDQLRFKNRTCTEDHG